MKMDLEQECRYKIDDEQITRIKAISKVVDEKSEQIDLTLGYAGFESLYKFGYVCRVRKKKDKIWMEVKNKIDDESFHETKVNLNNFQNGVEFFKSIGMKPYMYMRRTREILEYKGLKLFIDDIELLGKFVEIEFQDITNAKEILEDFLKEINITTDKQPLYGDILNNLLKNNEEFKKEYQEKLQKFIDSKE